MLWFWPSRSFCWIESWVFRENAAMHHTDRSTANAEQQLKCEMRHYAHVCSVNIPGITSGLKRNIHRNTKQWHSADSCDSRHTPGDSLCLIQTAKFQADYLSIYSLVSVAPLNLLIETTQRELSEVLVFLAGGAGSCLWIPQSASDCFIGSLLGWHDLFHPFSFMHTCLKVQCDLCLFLSRLNWKSNTHSFVFHSEL